MKKGLVFLIVLVLLYGCVTQEVAEEIPEGIAEEVAEEPETPVVEPEAEEEPEMPVEEPKTQAEEQPEPTEIIDPNLVAYWKLDGDAKDSAGGYDGTVKGGAGFAEGKKGKALSFDGVDDYVDFSQDAVDKIGSLSKGTIAFWFNYKSLLDKQTVMPIFYIGIKDGSPKDNMFLVEIGHSAKDSNVLNPADKRLYSTWIKDHRDPYICFDSNVNLAENKWHHFAVVVRDEGNTGYLNGVEMSNRDYNFGGRATASFLADIPMKEKLYLGYGRSYHTISPGFVYYKGLLDDVRVYNRSLSSSEIKELAESS